MLTCVGTAHAATVEEVSKSIRNLSPVQRKAVIEEGARKEGEVIWYTSMSLTDFPKIVGAFEKTVPQRLRSEPIDYRSLRSCRKSTRKLAPADFWSMWWLAPMEMWELKQKNHSTSYLSPEIRAFPAGSYDPQGYWSSFEVTPLVLAFNTNLVRPDEAPRSYQDLLRAQVARTR